MRDVFIGCTERIIINKRILLIIILVLPSCANQNTITEEPEVLIKEGESVYMDEVKITVSSEDEEE